MTIGQKVSHYRKREGLTLKTLAKKVRCSVSFLCDIEHDRRKPDTLLASRMERALGTDPQALALQVALETGVITFDPGSVTASFVIEAISAAVRI